VDTVTDRRWDAYRVYLITSAAIALFQALIFTVNLLFQVERVGLNALQLVLVGTALEGAAFIFEIPTGVVADVYSRRLSIIIGNLIMGVGLMLYAVPNFAMLLVASALWGLGYTFTSGATQAWLADELGEERSGRAYLRGAQLAQAGVIVGTLAAIALGQWRLNLPIMIGGAGFIVLAVFQVLAMPERGFSPTPRAERETWNEMRGTFLAGTRLVRARPILLTIIAIELVHGAYSEGWDRLWTAHLVRDIHVPTVGGYSSVVWIGAIELVIALLAMGATQLALRHIDTTRHTPLTRALVALEGMLIAGVLGFALFGSFWVAAGCLVVVALVRELLDPLKAAWTNQSLEPGVRATVFSMTSQSNALGQIAVGPAVGAFGTAYTIRAALVLVSIILSPVLLLYARAFGQGAVVTEADVATVAD
jgi:DHA3 family tetracycline resistance protein-like MFS transporter